jgi:hypothetical protein
MKIELRNVKINLTFSEETTMFKADVYVNGKKTAYAHNDGHGGCTFYNRYPNMEGLLVEAENYAKTLPKLTYGSLSIDTNLEHLIDKMIDEEVNKKEHAKFAKKREKDMLKNIVYGNPTGGSYKMIGWGKYTIEQLKSTQNGITALKNAITRVKGELTDGDKILNNNLGELLG